MCPSRMKEKTKRKNRFKQMSKVNNQLLTLHRRLLDQGHGQAPAPRPPVKQPAPGSLFARPDSRAGFAQPKPTSPHSSPSSSTSGPLFQEDVDTSVSWELIDTDTDTEVANINSQSPHKPVTNKNCADSSNESQNHTVGLNHQLTTLYNQDFFVAEGCPRFLISPAIRPYCLMGMQHFS